MKSIILTAGLLAAAASPLLLAGGQAQPAAPPTMHARAAIAGEGITGSAEFTESLEGTVRKVEVVVKVTGLKPGRHGMHLHAVGKCDGPAFTSAGGHFDPGPFGNVDPDLNHPFHMGDLPNLEADPKGDASVTAVTTRVTLSAGPLSVFDADGTALIIHANPDQEITGAAKSGVSGGPRIACGVLEKK